MAVNSLDVDLCLNAALSAPLSAELQAINSGFSTKAGFRAPTQLRSTVGKSSPESDAKINRDFLPDLDAKVGRDVS